MYRETMEQSWLSSTIDYVYNTVSGDERDRSGTSDYQKVFSNGVWINDLPTSVYEPLETSCVGTRATPKQYEKELKEMEQKIAALKVECAEKNKEIASLKDKLEDLEASSRKTDSNAETKPDETQQELKKAKRTAFVSRAILIKKNLELDHLKNELESAKERERQWKDSNGSLKSQIFELRQQLADFKKDVFDEIKRHQLPTDFAELDSFKERERQWKERIDFLTSQISELQQQLADFKRDVFEQIKRCQPPTGFAELGSSKEKETRCHRRNSTVIREEAKELKEKIEKVQEKIYEQEQNICQQNHQLQNLLPPTNVEQAMPKACPPPPPPPPGVIQHSNLLLPSQSSNGDGIRKDNPYSLRAVRAKRSVLNARPLPPNIGAVQTPAGFGQLMNNPYSKVNEVYQPNPIWNPCAGSYSANGHLNSRPLPRNVAPGYTSQQGMSYVKGEESGFFTRTFNKWFGF